MAGSGSLSAPVTVPGEKQFTGPELPGNATYTIKSVRFTVPAHKALHITVEMYGIKAHSAFLSMTDWPGYHMIYKGEANSEPTRLERTWRFKPRENSQAYLLTMASKDTPGREASQPWWNNHPLTSSPVTDAHRMLSIWETDDSRYPASVPNVRVTSYHTDYDPAFVPIP